MLNTISEILKKQLLSHSATKNIATIEYLLYSYIENLTTLFVFLNNKSAPDFVALYAQKDLGQKILSVNQTLHEVLKENIVSPTLVSTIDDQVLIIYKYLPSTTFYQRKIKDRKKLISKGLQLLLEITEIYLSKNNNYWTNEEVGLEIKKDLDIFNAHVKNDSLLDKLNKDLEHMLEYLSLKCLKFVRIPQHGDYILGNMRFVKDKVYLFDFELVGDTNIPFYDFVTFLVSLPTEDSEIIINIKKRLRDDLYSDFTRKYADLIKLDQNVLVMLSPFLLVKFYNNFLKPGYSTKTRALVYKIIENYYSSAESDKASV